MKLAGVRIPRWIGLAIGFALIGSFAHAPAVHAAPPKTSLNVAYIYNLGTGANDPTPQGGSIFKNAVTGVPPGVTYTTADSSKVVTITNVTVASIDIGGAAVLAGFDTAILYMVCDIGSSTHANTMTALNSFIAGGKKLLIFDGDRCAPGFGGSPNYSTFLFPFTSSNPGPQGSGKCYIGVQPSTLTTGLAGYCDPTGVSDPLRNDSIGDANAFVTFNGNWCGSLTAKNFNNVEGFIQAYARTPAGGLVVFSGEDFWFPWGPRPHQRLVFDNELKQDWAPDGLPCALPASGVSLAPVSATNVIGDPHTLTAKVVDITNTGQAGITVTFKITSGPNMAAHPGTDTGVTNASGQASIAYTSALTGTDKWVASFVDILGNVHNSNEASKTWILPPPANLVLSPKTATNTVGTPHCVTATVTDSKGKPVANTVVNFTVTGKNPTTGAATTNASGQAMFCYTGTVSGADTITATAVGGSNPSDTAAKTWKPGAPATLVLTPKTATNVVGNSHTVTATVRDQYANLVPNATVTFTVTGANTATGTAVTNASGQATFTYTGTNFGADAIAASASATAKDTAAKTWTLATLDNFKCYSVVPKGAEDEDDDSDSHHGRRIVTLTDQFGTARVAVKQPRLLCNPASNNGSTINTPTAHLKGYDIESSSDFNERLVQVTNKYGTETLKVEDRAILAEPASKAPAGQTPGPVPITLNNFECYSVEGKARRPAPTATLSDQFGTGTVAIGSPVLLCNPAKKNNEGIGPVAGGPAHLVCYEITRRGNVNLVVETRDQFGTETLRVKQPKLLCVPSDKKELPNPPDDNHDDNHDNNHDSNDSDNHSSKGHRHDRD
jgi:hypothetical protein